MASSGRVSHSRVSKAEPPTSRRASPKGWLIALRLASNRRISLSRMKSIISQPHTTQPSTSTVLVSSLLLATLPSLRASRIFFWVGGSVLSAPWSFAMRGPAG